MNHMLPVSGTLGGEVVINSLACVACDSLRNNSRFISVIYSVVIILASYEVPSALYAMVGPGETRYQEKPVETRPKSIKCRPISLKAPRTLERQLYVP